MRRLQTGGEGEREREWINRDILRYFVLKQQEVISHVVKNKEEEETKVEGKE